MIRSALRGLTVSAAMVGMLAAGAVTALASPAALPDAGFGTFPCGGEIGDVRIPGYISRTGFNGNGELWKMKVGTMTGLTHTAECADAGTAVRLRG